MYNLICCIYIEPYLSQIREYTFFLNLNYVHKIRHKEKFQQIPKISTKTMLSDPNTVKLEMNDQ